MKSTTKIKTKNSLKTTRLNANLVIGEAQKALQHLASTRQLDQEDFLKDFISLEFPFPP